MPGERPRREKEERFEEPSLEMKRMIYNLVEGLKTSDENKQLDKLEAIKSAINMRMEEQWTTRKSDLDFLEKHLRNYLTSGELINKPRVSKKIIELLKIIEEAKQGATEYEEAEDEDEEKRFGGGLGRDYSDPGDSMWS